MFYAFLIMTVPHAFTQYLIQSHDHQKLVQPLRSSIPSDAPAPDPFQYHHIISTHLTAAGVCTHVIELGSPNRVINLNYKYKVFPRSS